MNQNQIDILKEILTRSVPTELVEQTIEEAVTRLNAEATSDGDFRPWRVRVTSTPQISGPGVLDYLKNMARQDMRGAIGQMINGFPSFPAALIIDILEDRLKYVVEGEVAIINWDGPLGSPQDYLYEWKTAFSNVGGSRRTWVETILDERQIPHRRLPREGRPDALQVPQDKVDETKLLLQAKIGARRVSAIPDEDPVFQDGGDAWLPEGVDFTGRGFPSKEEFDKPAEGRLLDAPGGAAEPNV